MRVICVDDERPILENFRLKTKDFSEIKSLHLFQNGEDALNWAEKNPVDVAFLDMEMSTIHGLELAKQLKALDQNIRIIFVTAFDDYALKAFEVGAIGYVLKPYSREDIKRELEKAALVRSIPKKKVMIRTIPNFSVMVDGNVLALGASKPKELLALLVDRADAGITSGDAIACLWPDRPADESTQTLYRVTFHRLMEILKSAGVDYIIGSNGRKKFIISEQIECDLYRILDGFMDGLRNYGGDYMAEYSWAENRNAQLNSMKEALQ